LIGYEVQKVLAGVDRLRARPPVAAAGPLPVGVCGVGEGGLVALCAAPRPLPFRGKSRAGLSGDFVVQTDWTVGRVFDALKRTRLADDTLVFFTSDNGPEVTRANENIMPVGAYDRVRTYGHSSMGPKRGTGMVHARARLHARRPSGPVVSADRRPFAMTLPGCRAST